MKTIKGEIVTSYLEKWNNLNNLTLAKKIYPENREVFKDIEDVRKIILYYRGANGARDLKKLVDRRFIRNIDDPNRFDIPDSDEVAYVPFTLPKLNNNILIIADLHIPYHNIAAINAAFSYGQRKEVNTIIIAGDFLDCYQLSYFCKDPRKRRFSGELDICREFFDALQDAFPMAVVYVMEGNHEERLKTYLKIKAPELFDNPEFNLDVLLQFGERGIHWICDKRFLKAGKLNIFHGHELGRGVGSTVNPARTLFLRAKKSAIQFHNHQTSEHSEPTIDDEIIACWSGGCLSELRPLYAPINKWNHGAAHVRVNPDGTFKVFNFRIHKGKVL